MKKDSKERLFEMMNKLDSSFNNKSSIINNILSNVGGKYYVEPKQSDYGMIDTGSDNAWVEIFYSEEKNMFICSLIFENERKHDMLGETIRLPMDFNNPDTTENKLKEIFARLNSNNPVDNIIQ